MIKNILVCLLLTLIVYFVVIYYRKQREVIHVEDLPAPGTYTASTKILGVDVNAVIVVKQGKTIKDGTFSFDMSKPIKVNCSDGGIYKYDASLSIELSSCALEKLNKYKINLSTILYDKNEKTLSADVDIFGTIKDKIVFKLN